MPTYDYKCDACGHGWEQFQSMTAAPIKRCPKCGKSKARRLIGTGAGLIFKGSGFYITDYRDAGYKDKAKADAGGGGGDGGEKKSEAATTSGGDAKTSTDGAAAKAEPKPATPKAEKQSASSSAAKKSAPKKND